ncbi:Uncharacterised protein [uncultured archaeon]|nr:Uncharacterised protein [uncultured archaeon]
MNKRGDSLVIETVTFTLFNLIFFVGMLIFIYNSGNQTSILEESYAKQIALMIDNAKPDMAVLININDVKDVALKNNKPLDKVFSLDKQTNKVKVSLNLGGGYAYSYFSSNDVSLQEKDNWLSVIIKKTNSTEK